MSHSHMNKNNGSKISRIKQTMQYAFFLVVFLWLLYQIHHSIYVRRDSDCDFIENNLTNDHIAEVLGRKGGVKVGKSLKLYGVDLIGGTLRLNNDTDGDDNESDKKDYERNGVDKSSEDVVNEVKETRGNTIMVKSGNMGSEKGVILRKGGNLEMFRFSDESGVPEHEFGASRIIEIVRKGMVSKPGNQTEEVEAYQNVHSQNETVNERPKMVTNVGSSK